MFAVFGVNYRAIEYREIAKGGTEDDIAKRVEEAFKKKIRLKLSDTYSSPEPCKMFIEMASGDNNFSKLDIRFYFCRIEKDENGKEIFKKTWVKYRGEKSDLELLANKGKR